MKKFFQIFVLLIFLASCAPAVEVTLPPEVIVTLPATATAQAPSPTAPSTSTLEAPTKTATSMPTLSAEEQAIATAAAQAAEATAQAEAAKARIDAQIKILTDNKIPYVLKDNGEPQFNFLDIYKNTASISEVHQATLAADLDKYAAIFDQGLPAPNTTDPSSFSVLTWNSKHNQVQDVDMCLIEGITSDYQLKHSPMETVGAVIGTIDGQQFVFFYERALLKDPAEIQKNGGNHFVTFWIAARGETFTNPATSPQDTLKEILAGERFPVIIFGMDSETLASGPEPKLELATVNQYLAFQLLQANLDDGKGGTILQVSSGDLLKGLSEDQGIKAEAQGMVFVGGLSRFITTIVAPSTPVITPTP